MKRLLPLAFAFLVSAVQAQNTAPAPAPAPAVAAAASGDVLTIVLKVSPDNDMMWDITEIQAKPGQKVKLTLENTSKQPIQHNWVLVKPGKDQVVANAAIQMAMDVNAVKKHYNPEASVQDIIAFTKLVDQNKQETIEFAAPAEAGEYPYICTFPGHFLLMKGKMIVK